MFPQSQQIVVEPPKSISDQVYEFIKTQIMTNRIKPGERLVESRMAEHHRTSRTPIREAIRRLEQDGFVSRIPQGGVRVSPISPEHIREVYGIRAVLESYVGELACEHIDRPTLQELREISRQAGDLLQRYGDNHPEEQVILLWQLNTRFHETIYRATQSRHLIRLLNNLRDMILRFRILTLQREREAFWEEHAQIIEYLEARDKEKLCPLMKEHTLRSGRRALDYLLVNAAADTNE